MRRYPARVPLEQVSAQQRAIASGLPHFTGRPDEEWIVSAGQFYVGEHDALCILTIDAGHHSCGWWKNPDYETCWHLSISFRDRESGAFAPHDRKKAQQIVRAFFREYANLAWCEPPYSRQGKEAGTWHYRLFVDPATRVPILPRGEVYSKQFTERGWKSFSELAEQEVIAR